MKHPVSEIRCGRTLTIAALFAFILSGCIHEQMITDRPPFAYPQNLISLCGKADTLSVKNRGGYMATSGFKSDLGYTYTDQSSRLLLSSQLLPGEPEWHRDVEILELHLSAQPALSIQTLDNRGIAQEHILPLEDISCSRAGELRLSFDSDSSYFYASVGKSSHELVLWTNDLHELILHSRWKESMAGLIGGSITGDAWAIFDVAEPITENASKSRADAGRDYRSTTLNCENLSGDYKTIGESISVDGSIKASFAGEQFFREEQVGIYAANPRSLRGTRLNLTQQESGEISLDLYDNDQILASRVLNAEAIHCENDHWVFEGSSESVTPAWIMLFGTGGLHWESLEIWRNSEGELLVKTLDKMRGAVMLVPVVNTNRLFISFPSLVKAESVD